MLRHARTGLLAIGVMCVAALGLGCEGFYPQPSADAAIHFLKNARLRGRLRVCWPAGQAYVEKVMKADATLRNGLAAELPFDRVDALWPADDPQWREKFAKPAEETGTEDAHETEQPVEPPGTQKALDELTAAIAELPAGLPLETPEEQAEFQRRVWEALAVDGVPLRQHVEQMQALADFGQRLEDRITACQEHFAEGASGLTFSDADCQREVDALYAEVAGALQTREEQFLSYAAEQMKAVHARIATINKQKDRDEYLYLDNTREYFDDVLRERWVANLNDRIRLSERKLAEHAAGDLDLPAAEAEFLSRDLDRLKKRHAHLKQRVAAILTPPEAGGD